LTAGPSPEAAVIGKTISHFKILEKLGEGGMGVVYKAEDTRLQRTVALKFVSRAMLGSDRATARFSREAQAAAACEHPNVCTVYEVGDSDEGTFIAMAFVDGRTLKEQLSEGPLSHGEAADIAIQVARGLRAAHGRGIIHRDIKPGNIMITSTGLVKIMDFGLARPPDVDEITGTGTAVGTVAYMSPEQARGETVDQRADIWSLGVVLYEMLVGQRPFRGQNPQAVLYSILNESPDPVSDVPQELDRIVRMALSKRVERRYQSVEDVLADLHALNLSASGATTSLVRPHGADSDWTNLPSQLTSFVGRQVEVGEVRRLIGHKRLLTLTGAGGSGKTRLAQEVARSLLEDFPGGAWLAELAPLREPTLVPQAVVTALGVVEASSRTPTEALVDYLRTRQLLLVLDSCEHLVEACAEFADTLLHACPRVHLLATSREPLAVTGEAIYHVPSLAVPGTDDSLSLTELADVAAVKLFVERAAAAESGFVLTSENAASIAEISRRLDGIPLALELAASRIKVLPASEIVRRLENRFALLSSGSRTAPPRHRTLGALIDWSYEQLAPNEQLLFKRLSIFAGGWALDSAEAVCEGGGIDESDVLELMSSLVEKSLVERLGTDEGTVPRYRMHESIREYAGERLSQGEKAGLVSKHKDHFLDLAQRAEPHLHGGTEQAAWLKRLREEHENIRSAFDTCIAHDAVTGLRLAAALGEYWNLGGHWNEGRRTCDELLEHPDAGERTVLRARVLRCASLLGMLQADDEGVLPYLKQSLAISREKSDRRGIAASLLLLGRSTVGRDDVDARRRLFEESLAISRELGRKGLVSECLSNLANIEPSSARQRGLFLESLGLFRETQDHTGEARALGNLAWLALNRGDYVEAQTRLEQGLDIYRGLADPHGTAWMLLLSASAAADQGELERARDLAEDGLSLTRKLGARRWESFGLWILGRVSRIQGDLAQARLLLESGLEGAKAITNWLEALILPELGAVRLAEGQYEDAYELLGSSLRSSIPRALAAGLEGLGKLAVVTGADARGARLFGAAAAFRQKENCPIPPVDKPAVDKGVSAARRRLGESAFGVAWDSGEAMSLKTAIDYAAGAREGADLHGMNVGTMQSTIKLPQSREAAPAHTNLPLQLTSLIGREEALSEVRRLLSENRLLTLTGAGGCGKTRLAQEVGRSVVENFPDGVWQVELAPLRQPELVAQAVATAIGLVEASSLTRTEALVNYLQKRNLLLVLDNCEHLLPACVQLADRLLRACPDIRLLATSREALAITGETVFRVPSLAVPDAEDRLPLSELGEVAAIKLFVERAAAAETGFELTAGNAPDVVEISKRLDGIPLALELAAARTRVLPLSEIARRLEDRFELLSSGSRSSPPRHQTLSALIDWSYEQLSDDERTLFGRLSVFAGGWALDSAEAVCADGDISVSDVLRLMSSLLEKSLVEKLASHDFACPRYRMHESIREYAQDNLPERETAWLERRHRDHFLELAERAEPHLHGGAEQVAWFRRLGSEHENLRAVFAACAEDDCGALVGLRLAGALKLYWEIRGHWSEGYRICTELLTRPEARAKTVVRARVLRAAGSLACYKPNYPEARELFEESLAISRSLEDRQGVAESLSYLGLVALREGDDLRARALRMESLAIARELDDKWMVSRYLNSLAKTEDDRCRVHELYLESLQLARELQDSEGEAVELGNLGFDAFYRGDRAEAISLIEDSLARYRELEDCEGLAWTLGLRADIAADMEDFRRARDFAEESLMQSRKLGSSHLESYALLRLGRIARLEGDLEEARVLSEEGLALAKGSGRMIEARAMLSLGMVCLGAGEYQRSRQLLSDSLALHWKCGPGRGFAASLEGLGIWAVANNSSRMAARLFGAADAFRQKRHCPIPPVDKPVVDEGVSDARQKLGESAFEEAWDSGRAMPGEEAIAYASGTRDEEGDCN
jgi:non-specific serine/threonine protein kinase